ncbi:substrate-binding domain-containing protein [Pseudothermotoga lettingae]|jgi:ribose transport system substrate-binding protein|uniref:Periplasmic binding protein/LacI transcriptional regulator n=1 Tax=Pseudothermotoga lettingae (strain ATCC BAA-301 / DSM 14385 / NBRC 107922 / TMO) TaxID=416591 RepID=A8F472_PSELT|nr:substrate-binding domain-containing protein [Pseudothermotoga lettingae]ABV32956.1 periplasmic binding protein/LacI transcriptional regulator [Pseudothermotoga lettingae TMO]MDI3495874.1 ribose transport system substrate-binding protein [Pseudothermotoga sp.]GLI48042.1 ABC transporter substrate-binding protein [Pseudothermotoga lettingae TMO]
MKKVLIFLLLIVTILSFAKFRVGVAIPAADHGWTGGMVWWAQYAIKQYANDPDVEFYLVTAKEPSEQIAQVQALLAKGIDALVINPYESAPLTPICVQAFRDGIFTIIVDRGINSEEYNVYIAGDNYMYGYLAGKYIAEKLGGKGNVVVIEGIPSTINTERVEAFKKALEPYPNVKIIAQQPGYWSREKAFEIMQTLLTKFPNIDAVWTGDDDMLHGVLLALKQAGRDKNIVLVGGACEKNIVKMIMDGHPLIGVDFTYPPNMISTAINLAVMALKGEHLNGFYQRGIPRKIILSTETVTKENAKDYYFPESVF